MTAKEPKAKPQSEPASFKLDHQALSDALKEEQEERKAKAEPEEQPQSKAEVLKEAGNKAFRAGSYRDAARIYAEAAERLANGGESDATVLLRVVLASNAAE